MAIIKTLISPKPLWSIFGNTEEPNPPDWYMPDKPQWKRELMWYFWRNPLHNFSWHLLGIAGKDFTSYGSYPDHVWNPNDGWNWAVRYYKWLRLPFVSYRGKYIESYAGWRNAGNLGLSLRKARS